MVITTKINFIIKIKTGEWFFIENNKVLKINGVVYIFQEKLRREIRVKITVGRRNTVES